MSEEEKNSETTEDEQWQKDKAVKLIEKLFTDEFRHYFGRSTYGQRRRGQNFICSVCTRTVCDDGVHWKDYKWLTVYPAGSAECCEFPHSVCSQHAHDVDDEPDLASIRFNVDREWDYIKDVDRLK